MVSTPRVTIKDWREVACPWCDPNLVADDEVLFPATITDSTFTPEVFSARRLPDRVHYQIVRCRRHGLVRSTPVLPTEMIHRLYAQSIVTYQDEEAALTATYMAALEPVLERLPMGARILEVGCGSGFLLRALAARGFEAWGLEPSTAARVEADPKIRSQIVTGTVESATWKKGSFDLICCFQVLDHFSDPMMVVSRLHDWTKRGGWFVSYHHDISYWLVDLLKDKHPIIDVEHTFLYAPATAAMLCRKTGYQVCKITSPWNQLSLRHVLELLPLPNPVKQWLLGLKSKVWNQILSMTIGLPLGNMCLYARCR